MVSRVLIVDDHKLLREGLVAAFDKTKDLRVVGEEGACSRLVECVQSVKPDVILLDLKLSDGLSLSQIASIRRVSPSSKILILTGMTEPLLIRAAIDAGITGYINKEESIEELLRAVRLVAAGKVYLCPAAATVLCSEIGASGHRPSACTLLSQRESEILAQVVNGKRSKEIAEILGINVKTVETYRCRLMAKLKVSNTAELVRHAVEHNLCRV